MLTTVPVKGLVPNVIQACAPIHAKGATRIDDLKMVQVYYNVLRLAKDNGMKTIAVPLLGIGIFNFPELDGVLIAQWTIMHFAKDLGIERVYICVPPTSLRILDMCQTVSAFYRAQIKPADQA